LGIIELHKGFRKVLYLDVDIHHGDGKINKREKEIVAFMNISETLNKKKII